MTQNNAPEIYHNFKKLHQWGYAPGSYNCFCGDCGKLHAADKRASRCLSCAETKSDLVQAKIDAAVAKERERCAKLVEKWATANCTDVVVEIRESE